MPVTLDMFEYPNHAAAQDSFVSSDRWDETFEQDTVDQDPSRWTVGEGGTSDVKIVAGKRCMLDSNAAACEVYTTVPFTKNAGEFEFKGEAAQVNAHFSIILGEGGANRIRIAFKEDGHFKYVNPVGPSWDNLPTDTTYLANTEYTIKIVWAADNTFSIFIGGVEKGTGLAFENNMTSGINWIKVYQEGNPTADFYFDDVIIGDSLTSYLQDYSEDTIIEQGSYSLKVIAKQTGSLNETLTRVVSPTVDLSDLAKIKLDVRASRIGTNIKARIRDSGGTWSEYSIAISSANTFETKEWDISGVSNKDAIDRIQFQIIEASADNTFYLDNMRANWWSKIFTENIVLSDSFSRTWSIYRIFTETLHLTDTFSRIVAFLRTFTEKISLTDKVKVAKTNLVNLIKKLIHLEDIED